MNLTLVIFPALGVLFSYGSEVIGYPRKTKPAIGLSVAVSAGRAWGNTWRWPLLQ